MSAHHLKQVSYTHKESNALIQLIRDQLVEKIQDTASRMLYENDQSLEGISSEQKKLLDGITSHTEDIKALHTSLSENGNKAD
jgi:hypothetical protein